MNFSDVVKHHCDLLDTIHWVIKTAKRTVGIVETRLDILCLKAEEDGRRFTSAKYATAHARGVIHGVNDALKHISKHCDEVQEVVVVVFFGLPLAGGNADLGVGHVKGGE